MQVLTTKPLELTTPRVCRCFSFADPRWGRIEETPGECPYVNGEYAYEFTKGFQEGYGEGVYSGPYIKVRSHARTLLLSSLFRLCFASK